MEIKVGQSVFNEVTKATQDKKITVAEIEAIKTAIKSDGITDANESILLNSLLEGKQDFSIVSRKSMFSVSKHDVSPISLSFEAPSIEDMKKGYNVNTDHSGATVKNINSLLAKWDFHLIQITSDDFTKETESLIKDFQQDHNLPVTGEVDIKTFEALQKAAPKQASMEDVKKFIRASIKPGDSGEQIAKLNQLIHQKDFTFDNVGDKFDEKTEAFIRNLQTQNNIVPTGKIDRTTLEKLEQMPAKIPTINQLKAFPQTTLKEGNNSDSVKMLHTLMSKVIDGFKNETSVFDAKTKNAISAFQSRNNIPITGEVDKRTLLAMEESTKLDESLIYNPNVTFDDSQTFDDDYIRIKELVSAQLTEKGVDKDQSFGVGENLVKEATKWDKKMKSDNKCYTAVKKALEDGMGIKYQYFSGYQATYARTADKNLLSNDKFVEITGLSRKDTQFLPPGAIIVYQPKSKKEPGHIGIQDGKGHDISDKTRNQSHVHTTAAFRVFYPVKKIETTPDLK